MKALRIRIPDTSVSKNVFRFIIVGKCAHIDLNYQTIGQLAFVQVLTNDGENFTLNKFMPLYDFDLFQSRYLKFINSDELFFNLSEFEVNLNPMICS